MFSNLSRWGKILIVFVIILAIFGIVMLSSAGIVESQKKCGAPYCFMWHQILYGLIPGTILLLFLAKTNYQNWRKLSLPILIFAIGLSILVFIPGIGLDLKGASRWVSVGPISFQPSEFLKLALIIYLAAWFGSRKKQASAVSYALTPFIITILFIIFVLILQPDFGTLGLIILVAISMYFLSGANWKHFLIIGLVLLLGLGSLAVLSPYRFSRIKTFLDLKHDPQGESYHINQSLISIGSGGIFGLGFGQSKQKHAFLPEPIGDSIFAIIVEELGFVGGLFVVALYFAITFSLIMIARGSPDEFSRLFVLGVALWISFQAFINIGAISGIIPLTGLPLPFISYGSSSLVALMSGLGIALNIAKK